MVETFRLVHDDCSRHYNSLQLPFTGDVMWLDIPTRPILVLGSAEAVTDLLEKRSDIYSDRPQNIMNELYVFISISRNLRNVSIYLGSRMTVNQWNFGFMDYTQEWRAGRRTFHQFFNQNVISDYQPIQLEERRTFLQRILDNPSKVNDHIHL